LAARADAVLAERLASLEAEARAAHAALEDETRAAHAERQAVLAEAEAALARQAASLVERTESVLAERLAALEAEARTAQAAREAALTAEARREAALPTHAETTLAARREQERPREAIAAEQGIAAEIEAAVADAHAALASGPGTWPPVELDGVLHREMPPAVETIRETIDPFAGGGEPALVRQRLAAAPPRGDGARTEDDADVAVVLPILGRPTLKLQQPLPQPALPAASTEASLVELLRSAAAHRASTVYAVVDTRPMMRVEGQINVVGTESSIAAGDVERFIFEFAPRNLVADAAPEWTCTVPGVGRVRCVTFHDQSGAGLIFHLPAAELSTADEVGLTGEIQALCRPADGLIVITGPRASGKSSILNAIVDVINRTRYDHVITIESRIRVRHERRCSFISQREVRGDGDAIASAARSALREGADVLVIEDLRAPEALSAALDAARAGRLVLGSISAPSAPVALERLVDAFPADRRPHLRASLAGALRAVVAQVLVPKVGGGRTAAREVLLSSPAVRKLLLEGATGQLPIAIEGGRSLGMRPMVDALGALVRDGIVEIADACGVAPDRAALIAALERDGVDVSAVERRA
ncbi:MAG: Flp pilus assembly complex ATPase component TadA, partial [Acidobacteriota bacterium]|nr:Flp pilus assembly complex ATPase component TadA [Acidobacteriota bacterium]